MAAITVPPCTDRCVYLKETARKGNDFSYGVIAARAATNGKQIDNIKLVLGSLTTKPIILSAPVQIIERDGLTDAGIRKAMEAAREELGNLTNLYTPAIYKSRLGRTLVRLALEGLRAQ